MPGTLVWNSGVSTGIVTPRVSVPNTSVIASIGQAILQAPWPMQSVGLISCALPPIRPSTLWSGCSGQATTQAPQPRQRFGSITGCSDTGSVSPASRASSSTASACASLRFCRPR